MYRITELLSLEERRTKAEAIILSKLRYCLEATSTDRKKDLEMLQSVQSQAARWVLGRGRRGWSEAAVLAEYLSALDALDGSESVREEVTRELV